MRVYCPDCGCKVYNGACVNCHEEKYIMQQHIEDPCCELSQGFLDTVATQCKDIQNQQGANYDR